MGHPVRHGLGPRSVLEGGQGSKNAASIVVFAGISRFDSLGADKISRTSQVGPALKQEGRESSKPEWWAISRRPATQARCHFIKQRLEGQVSTIQQEALPDAISLMQHEASLRDITHIHHPQ